MENVTDALIMAGSVLMFIVALTVGISSFTTLRESIDEVVGQTETVEMAKDSDGYINYIESRDNGAVRIVGSETVVSSMYRAVKENYVIYIQFTDDDTYNGIPKVYTNTEGEKFLKVTIDWSNPSVITNVDDFIKSYYKKIKGRKYFEYLGEYQNASAEGVSSENKQTKRIITYKEITTY